MASSKQKQENFVAEIKEQRDRERWLHVPPIVLFQARSRAENASYKMNRPWTGDWEQIRMQEPFRITTK